MFVRTPRASAWRDDSATSRAEASASDPTTTAVSGPSGVARPRSPVIDVLYARKALETRLGRCVAIKKLQSARGERLLVLLVPRYSSDKTPQWLPTDKVMEEHEALTWVRTGFSK